MTAIPMASKEACEREIDNIFTLDNWTTLYRGKDRTNNFGKTSSAFRAICINGN